MGETNIKYKWFIYYLETNQFKSTVDSAKQKTVSTNKYRNTCGFFNQTTCK